MPSSPDSPWKLVGFTQRLDEWIAREQPADELRRLVTAALLSRIDNPYNEADRADGFANLWSYVVPGSLLGGDVVLCSYWIDVAHRELRCDSIATLSWPV